MAPGPNIFHNGPSKLIVGFLGWWSNILKISEKKKPFQSWTMMTTILAITGYITFCIVNALSTVKH